MGFFPCENIQVSTEHTEAALTCHLKAASLIDSAGQRHVVVVPRDGKLVIGFSRDSACGGSPWSDLVVLLETGLE